MQSAIPSQNFGGSGPLLHFATSNGYPPRCFQQFLAPLSEQYSVKAIIQRPLWPNTPPSSAPSWDVFTQDILKLFDQNGWRKVIGVGHSLGAVATLDAARQRPDLFKALVLIEPVFLPPWIPLLAKVSPQGLRNRFPPAKVALRRRERWPDRQAAFDHFRPKRVFRFWPDSTLWDFVNHGLIETANGEVTLAWSRDWEAQIYSTPPIWWPKLKDVPVPTLGLRGAKSDTLFPKNWARWQQLQPEATFVELQNTAHMLPMERPVAVAEEILQFLEGV